MPRAVKSLLAIAAVSLSIGACSQGASLRVGSKAPNLHVSRWIKGDGPSALEAGKVYVVEFWATWCPPCRESIPHITKLAHAYQDRVTFVGVSVWERGPEENVDEFVRNMGDRMNYLVARDTASNYMAKAWLEAAGQDGIPSAFIVDGDGKIAWIGHPMGSMDKAIQGVLSKAKK
jgi:thiol-disulfide isomerase/thioredoxin